VAHGFWLLMTHDRKQKIVRQPHSPVTQGVCDFWGDKKGKVLGTSVIKVNDFFTLNDVSLVDRLRYNLLFVSQLVDADLDVLFTSLILTFLIHLANIFVASLALEMFCKLISHLLNLL
jgi:hypothetical protein